MNMKNIEGFNSVFEYDADGEEVRIYSGQPYIPLFPALQEVRIGRSGDSPDYGIPANPVGGEFAKKRECWDCGAGWMAMPDDKWNQVIARHKTNGCIQ